MNLFDYTDYKKYVNAWIESQEKGGHGQLKKMSEYLEINSVVMSQVFRGTRELSMEQGLGVSKFIGHSPMERDYFLILVQASRAGTLELKHIFLKQAQSLSESAQVLKNRVKHQKMTDEHHSIFYSHWTYSASRLCTSIPSINHASAVAEFLGIERTLAVQIIGFLKEHKLVVEKNGQLDMGPSVTHVGHDSPFVNRHHTNWRLQGLQAMEKKQKENFFYTGPMALSQAAVNDIRKTLIDLIEKFTKKATHSDSEVLRCLNIDWFKIEK